MVMSEARRLNLVKRTVFWHASYERGQIYLQNWKKEFVYRLRRGRERRGKTKVRADFSAIPHSDSWSLSTLADAKTQNFHEVETVWTENDKTYGHAIRHGRRQEVFLRFKV